MNPDTAASGWTCSECGLYVSAGRWHVHGSEPLDNFLARLVSAEQRLNMLERQSEKIKRAIDLSARDRYERQEDAHSKEAGHAEAQRQELIARCATPVYHTTHNYCPSCPWQYEGDKDVAETVGVSAATIAARQGPDGFTTSHAPEAATRGDDDLRCAYRYGNSRGVMCGATKAWHDKHNQNRQYTLHAYVAPEPAPASATEAEVYDTSIAMFNQDVELDAFRAWEQAHAGAVVTERTCQCSRRKLASVAFRAGLLWAQKETARALLLEAKIEADRKLARLEGRHNE